MTRDLHNVRVERNIEINRGVPERKRSFCRTQTSADTPQVAVVGPSALAQSKVLSDLRNNPGPIRALRSNGAKRNHSATLAKCQQTFCCVIPHDSIEP